MSDRAKPTSAEQAKGSARAKGSAQAKGSVKEAIGKLIGDARIEAEGKAQKQGARTPKTASRRD